MSALASEHEPHHFDFNEQLAEGHSGECDLEKFWPEFFHRQGGTKEDFLCGGEDFGFEVPGGLKTESASLENGKEYRNRQTDEMCRATPNFSVERYGQLISWDRNTLEVRKLRDAGGPYQEKEKGSKVCMQRFAGSPILRLVPTEEYLSFLGKLQAKREYAYLFPEGPLPEGVKIGTKINPKEIIGFYKNPDLMRRGKWSSTSKHCILQTGPWVTFQWPIPQSLLGRMFKTIDLSKPEAKKEVRSFFQAVYDENQ